MSAFLNIMSCFPDRTQARLGSEEPAARATVGLLRKAFRCLRVAARDAGRRDRRMQEITGTVLLVQEGRLRLLTEEGQGRVFLLAPEAPIEPQDLPPLAGRRVCLSYHDSPRLQAGVIRDLRLLPN